MKNIFELFNNLVRRNMPSDDIWYKCNICGGKNRKTLSELGRETNSCSGCGSTVRMRSIIYLLSMELFSSGKTISSFPIRKDIKGIGMSDWIGYASRLEKKFNYVNTYYHKEPRLDISDIHGWNEDTYDFIISSDVFEHVAPPVSKSFKNAYSLLKPGGIFIFSVPFTIENSTTVEHFPDLHDYEIDYKSNKPLLRNTTKEGKKQIFSDLVFHGGEGDTLEMRVFSKSSLLKNLEEVGFVDIRIRDENDLNFGIYWKSEYSIPITARKSD
jgi:SAM-dependent methyltransferase